MYLGCVQSSAHGYSSGQRSWATKICFWGQKIEKSPIHLFAETLNLNIRTPDQLKNNNYNSWLVVEAEQDPSKANPFEYAKIGYNYLSKSLAHTNYKH